MMTCSVTILLLDDEPILRAATALMLARRGGRVSVAANADEAAALARERAHDVAVVDVSPAGPGGEPGAAEVIRRLRAEGQGIGRAVAVSGEPLRGREAEGLDVVLPRPYPFDDLLRAIFREGRGRPAGRDQAARPGLGAEGGPAVIKGRAPTSAVRAGRGRAGRCAGGRRRGAPPASACRGRG
jgi:CheY-like chemotaxis protein